jgi:hypothetical protein
MIVTGGIAQYSDICRIATLYTINPTQTALELNPGPSIETNSINRLNPGMAVIISD